MCFDNTRAALAIYDAGSSRRDAILNEAMTEMGVDAWHAEETQALNEVRSAFHRDTRGTNSRAYCANLSLELMRACSRNFSGITNSEGRSFTALLKSRSDKFVMSALVKNITAGLNFDFEDEKSCRVSATHRARALLAESEARKRKLIKGSPVHASGLLQEV